ncbi:MAG: AtpZ/AtpI family protein [Psychroserpens sp.]|uniref:AtpZ/AtpI family protein n=1 Tax=Psychroserpens sp. TaxID=2020870 RepID=UPI00302ACD06
MEHQDNNQPSKDHSDQVQKKDKPFNTYTRLSGIVVQMVAIIGFGTFIGYRLDEKYPNEHNLYTLAGSLSSVILSIIYIIRRIIAASKDD